MNFKLIGKNVPSAKNSKRAFRRKIIKSQLSMNYEKWIEPLMKELKDSWLIASKDKELPIYVGFYFYRDSKRKWDFNNITQTLQDLMVKYEWIEDDDTKHFIPIYLGEEVVNKEESGVVFKILEDIECIKNSKINIV